jgi:hypothetical protein
VTQAKGRFRVKPELPFLFQQREEVGRMITVNVKKLFNGTISLRDFIIRKCVERGIPLKVIHGNQYMILSPTELVVKRFQLTNRVFKSKFGGRNYQLFDYQWNPLTKNEN